MPEIREAKKKDETPKSKDDPSKVVSAYSDEGQARIAKSRKRDRLIIALSIVLFVLLLSGLAAWIIISALQG